MACESKRSRRLCANASRSSKLNTGGAGRAVRAVCCALSVGRRGWSCVTRIASEESRATRAILKIGSLFFSSRQNRGAISARCRSESRRPPRSKYCVEKSPATWPDRLPIRFCQSNALRVPRSTGSGRQSKLARNTGRSSDGDSASGAFPAREDCIFRNRRVAVIRSPL